MILVHLAHRVLAVAGTTSLAVAGLVGAAAPAQAAACSGTNGVTVVVQSNDGPNSTRCASGDPSSAMEALRSAGFSVSQPSRFPGAICRINGYPSSDPCVNMPPAEAYWAFFHAPAGGSWTYSDSGPSSYNPKPGSSVGFRFGSGSAPSTQPAAPAPAPAPKPTTAAPKPTTAAPEPTAAAPKAATAPGTTAPSTRATTGTATGATPPTSPTPGGPGTSSSASASTASSSAPSASTSPSPSGSPSATAEALDAQQPPKAGSGSSGRLVGGGVLLLALASAVGAVAVRRRAIGA